MSISPRAPVKESSRVVPGLVLSNEPGLYRAGQYGIRTENLVTPVVDETMLSAMQPMLRMQTLSLAPIETRLIKTAMMTPMEINWVNDYHNRVREELMPLLSLALASGLSEPLKLFDLFLAASDYTDLNQVSKTKGYYCFGRPILPAKLGTI